MPQGGLDLGWPSIFVSNSGTVAEHLYTLPLHLSYLHLPYTYPTLDLGCPQGMGVTLEMKTSSH